MDSYNQKIDLILPEVQRPGRYAGNELYSIVKDPEGIEVSFALAFPEVYEIGMSNVGMCILYHILNKYSWISAERVYAPWIDMENRMREENIPLFSLESRKLIRDFDILGFSLQYELQYTNVLNMIDMADIPLRTQERIETDPFIIAGGPCAFNPEPVADFLDAVVVGDGEEVVIEIVNVIREAKQDKRGRQEILESLSQVEGVYIPSFFRTHSPLNGRLSRTVPVKEGISDIIRACVLKTLSPENYPHKPMVPLIEVTHDRFSLEIMRGCSRGCRFCNAGVIYRPVRQRSVKDLVEQAREVISNTGYEELSLVSLSTSDYSCLLTLLSRFRDLFHGKGVSMSLPSMRPDTFTSEIADFAQGPRRSGLTLAPEAGTQRLRDVINKCIVEEDILRAIETAYKKGWQRIKLYFMIGLPTETQEDLEGILTLVDKVVRVGKKFGKKEVHVSISPFSPKAHTPFQWEAQNSLEELKGKIDFIRKGMTQREVKLNWRDTRVSQLEAALGRGDRRLGDVVYRAWQSGARFDAWSEQFDHKRWLDSFKAAGLQIEDYTGKIELNDPLPWDHIHKGVTKSYLIQERKYALSADVSQDCRLSECKQCGLMSHPACQEVMSTEISKNQEVKSSSLKYGRDMRQDKSPAVTRRIRIQYEKDERSRFTSHLDTVRVIERTLRRANISVALTRGYHTHFKISTGPPLPLGYISRVEYMDIEVENRIPKDFVKIMNSRLPVGFHIVNSRWDSKKLPSLNSSITLASYRIVLDEKFRIMEINNWIDKFLEKNSFKIIRKKQGKEKEIDIRLYVVQCSLNNEGINLLLRLTQKGTARVEEVLQAILSPYNNALKAKNVERTGLYIEKQNKRLTPMQIE